jgi:hypothetical protein
MKFVFTGDPAELEADRGLSRTSTVMFGKIFPMGAEVDVSDLNQDQLRKLLGNREFMDASVAGGMRGPLIIPASVASAADAGVDGEEEAAVAAHAERAAAKKTKKA